ncbi:MAG TPA: hypothetical protein VGE01_11075, partial [Fimbriimonas sp.]
RRLAEREGISSSVSAHADWRTALDGADYVVCSAAREMNRRFRMDREIIDRHAPGHLVTEFGGVAGISYSLRQIALVRKLCEDMKRLCPDAWLLNISNPLPRVCQAAHEAGIKTIGFCSVSLVGYGMLDRLFRGKPSSYPFEESQARYDLRMGGTNHLSWLVELRDRDSGQDMMPSLRNLIHNRGRPSKCEVYGRRTGYMLMSGDDHVQDFLPPEGLERSLEISSHGSDEDRIRREEILRKAARGEVPFEAIEEMVSWERPIDLIAALSENRKAEFSSLNLVNDGQIPSLPSTAFVETRCVADGNGVTADLLELPETVLPYTRNAIEVTEAIVRGAEQRSTAFLKKALFADPTVVDKHVGWKALDACLQAHEDLIGAFR